MASESDSSSEQQRQVDAAFGAAQETDATASAAASGDDNRRLAEQLADAQDRALRAQAELENYRKRARRELEDERRYATLPLLRDILSVVDNLQLAIQAAEQHQDNAGLLEGVKLVSRQLIELLKQHHCQEIEAENTQFDPHSHEAVLHEPSEQHPAGGVTRVTRSGYRLHDRVVRPSQVFVSSGAPPTAPKD